MGDYCADEICDYGGASTSDSNAGGLWVRNRGFCIGPRNRYLMVCAPRLRGVENVAVVDTNVLGDYTSMLYYCDGGLYHSGRGIASTICLGRLLPPL